MNRRGPEGRPLNVSPARKGWVWIAADPSARGAVLLFVPKGRYPSGLTRSNHSPGGLEFKFFSGITLQPLLQPHGQQIPGAGDQGHDHRGQSANRQQVIDPAAQETPDNGSYIYPMPVVVNPFGSNSAGTSIRMCATNK